jgi:FKBP-type peptidyl-prolyl cis-trans isomerase FkpA
MKYLSFLLLFIIPTFFNACKNDEICCGNNGKVPECQLKNLQSYIETNSITATKDNRGFYYNIISEGSGINPTIGNSVKVNYKGSLTNGTQFDAGNDVIFSLAGLIKGWQLGIPLIKPGGKIFLYVPPALAYDCSGAGSIPPNSILVFEIDLIAVY